MVALGLGLPLRRLDRGGRLLLPAALLGLLLTLLLGDNRPFALGMFLVLLLLVLLAFALLVFGHCESPYAPRPRCATGDAGGAGSSAYWSICAPLRLATRTRLPFSSSFVPIRVGFFESGSMSARFERWMLPFVSTMPPSGAAGLRPRL